MKDRGMAEIKQQNQSRVDNRMSIDVIKAGPDPVLSEENEA